MAAIQIKTASKVVPQCYAYTTPGVPVHDGWTKIGFTERDVETRINEQTHTVGVAHKTWWAMRAAYMTEPYGTFTDKDFHAYLKKLGISRESGTEWFRIEPNTARGNFIDFTQNHSVVSENDADAVIPYKLRDEQAKAVQRTADYFRSRENAEFLWNTKPRFGKTLSAYDLCMKLGAKNILIVTNRPAIANSWYQDYETFFGPQSGYLFVSNVDGIKDRKFVYSREEYIAKLDENTKGCIEFVSLQDLKGSIYFGGRFDKLSELSAEKGLTWDVLIVDEAHEGVDTYKTDTLLETTRGYGDTEKPQDYLDSFVAYVNENKDRIEAIRIACTRPSDMTRAQLRELKLELDKENFTESSLNEAASAVSNERIVADIIAFVRRAVLKTPLVNHDDRVKMAFSKLTSAHHFNKMQLDLLEKIKAYMLHESILNTETFEAPAFKMDGGFARFNKKFGGQLAEIIREINTYIYEGAA